MKREEALGNGRILASISVPDLKGNELGSGHPEETPEPQAGTARETANGYVNKVRIPEFAGSGRFRPYVFDLGSQPETLKRNGVTWSMYSNSEQSRTAAANVMKKKAGPTIKIQTILDAFKLFFTNRILDQIVLHTNLYAKRYYDKKIRSQQDSNNIRFDSYCWKRVDRVELESFIGLLIQSGVHRSNHELLNDLWDVSRSCPLYRATMSLQRF